jgi:nitrate/TMAO reductase-like tetraheme cytochrome c subunit
MPESAKQPKKKNLTIIPMVMIAGVVLVLMTAGGFAFAASQESNDSFCASCHTQPESTYFQRATAGQPSDMASFHTTQKTLCIDCHSGQGLMGRVQAELLGASNAFKWFTGTAVQPAVLLYPIGDQNCLKCHQNVTRRGYVPKLPITVPGARGGRRDDDGGNNHWHEQLAKWQAAAAASAGTCVTCHSGHAAGFTAQSGFMNAQKVQATCDACHRVLRRDDD